MRLKNLELIYGTKIIRGENDEGVIIYSNLSNVIRFYVYDRRTTRLGLSRYDNFMLFIYLGDDISIDIDEKEFLLFQSKYEDMNELLGVPEGTIESEFLRANIS